MAEVDVETRIPTSIANDLIVDQIMDFIDRMAKAGRADEGAVGTTQASRRHIVPMRMIEFGEQSVPDPIGFEMAHDLIRSSLPPLRTP
jgi:hypothetical protein